MVLQDARFREKQAAILTPGEERCTYCKSVDINNTAVSTSFSRVNQEGFRFESVLCDTLRLGQAVSYMCCIYGNPSRAGDASDSNKTLFCAEGFCCV